MWVHQGEERNISASLAAHAEVEEEKVKDKTSRREEVAFGNRDDWDYLTKVRSSQKWGIVR